MSEITDRDRGVSDRNIGIRKTSVNQTLNLLHMNLDNLAAYKNTLKKAETINLLGTNDYKVNLEQQRKTGTPLIRPTRQLQIGQSGRKQSSVTPSIQQNQVWALLHLINIHKRIPADFELKQINLSQKIFERFLLNSQYQAQLVPAIQQATVLLRDRVKKKHKQMLDAYWKVAHLVALENAVAEKHKQYLRERKQLELKKNPPAAWQQINRYFEWGIKLGMFNLDMAHKIVKARKVRARFFVSFQTNFQSLMKRTVGDLKGRASSIALRAQQDLLTELDLENVKIATKARRQLNHETIISHNDLLGELAKINASSNSNRKKARERRKLYYQHKGLKEWAKMSNLLRDQELKMAQQGPMMLRSLRNLLGFRNLLKAYPHFKHYEKRKLAVHIARIIFVGDSKKDIYLFIKYHGSHLTKSQKQQWRLSFKPEGYQKLVLEWRSKLEARHLDFGLKQRTGGSTYVTHPSSGGKNIRQRARPFPVDLSTPGGQTVRIVARLSLDLDKLLGISSSKPAFSLASSKITRARNSYFMEDIYAKLNYGIKGRFGNYKMDTRRVLGAFIVLQPSNLIAQSNYKNVTAEHSQIRKSLTQEIVINLVKMGWLINTSSQSLFKNGMIYNLSKAVNLNAVTKAVKSNGKPLTRSSEIKKMIIVQALQAIGQPTLKKMISVFYKNLQSAVQVTKGGNSRSSRSGRTVVVQHTYSKGSSNLYVYVVYRHLGKVRSGLVGKPINIANMPIFGEVGSTGNAISSHIHIEVIVKKTPGSRGRVFGWLSPYDFFPPRP